MSRWLELEAPYPGLVINRDAGPSWITCTHRGKCGCQEASERAVREQRATQPAQTPAPAVAPAKPAQPLTWREFEEGCGNWKDDLARIIETLRAFPDALKAILALLDARDVAT